MSSNALHTHDAAGADARPRLGRHEALRRVQPGPLGITLVLAGLLACFLVPAIALCGWLRGFQIIWVIAGTTGATGFAYLAFAYRLEARDVLDPRIEQLLISGVLLIAAGVLYASVGFQPGPMSARSFEPWTLLAVGLMTPATCAVLMLRRVRRLTSSSATGEPRLRRPSMTNRLRRRVQ